MQGWVSLHREILEKAIWTESTPEQKVILITLLLLANHKEKEWEWKGDRYKARPGQFVTSLKSIAEKSGKDVTIKKVRTALEKFEKYGFLANESTNKNRLITIVNWELYQSLENKRAGTLAGKGQAEGRQRATNNNDNNDNKKDTRKKTYEESSIEYKLASHLYQEILKNNPEHRKPDIQKWANDIRLMIERDNRKPEKIKGMIEWSQNDDFWRSNILSTTSLRKHYDKMNIQAFNKFSNKKTVSQEKGKTWKEKMAEEGLL